MTISEENRIENFKTYIENGKLFFNQLFTYYTNEYVLNIEDITQFKDNVIKLIYLYKPYLLELTYNEKLNLGQILVYDCEMRTHFLPEPKFKLKKVSQIYFDYPGNLYINSTTIAHQMPSRSAEDIIREICK